MATVADMPVLSEPAEVSYPITSEMYVEMVQRGLIPPDRRVFLWDGRLYEKMAKSLPHAAVQTAFLNALMRRLGPGLFLGSENPVRLDATHMPLPDLIVARGRPLDFFDTRYPDGRDVVLVVEVAVTSLPEDLGIRLTRYAQSLPMACYVVADVPHRQVLVHDQPRAAEDPTGPGYARRTVVKPGESIRLRLGDVDLEPIPFEDVMR